MSAEEVDIILKKNNLSVTGSRKKILDIFLAHPDALSHSFIEKNAGERFDRVTVYRTLQTFLEKGIIHSIPTADNTVLYALCKDECSEGHHHDDHIHFMCNQCGKTICLDNVSIPVVKLPKGFRTTQTAVIVNGTCKDCA